jgi:hypothetical protein
MEARRRVLRRGWLRVLSYERLELRMLYRNHFGVIQSALYLNMHLTKFVMSCILNFDVT